MMIFKIKNKFYEKFPRTLLKAVTWRMLMMVTNSLIGWYVTGNPWKGLTVGLMALVINSILYIFHERAWNRVDWDKQINEDVVTDPVKNPA